MSDSLAAGPPAPVPPAAGRPTRPTAGGRPGTRGTAAIDVVPVPPGVRLRAAWARARARNALRRPGVIGGVGGVVLASALAALVLVPREAMRAARNAAPRPGEKLDTTRLAARAAEARTVVGQAAQALAAKRQLAAREAAARVARARAAAALAAARGGAGRRDSLLALADELDRLIGRVQTSPLPNSFRALAGAGALRGDPRVRAAIDSLDDVEREREAFGLVGGVDPVYVSLTNRVTQLGRVVEGVADRRRAALRAEAAAAAAAAAAVPLGADPAGAAGGPGAAATPGGVPGGGADGAPAGAAGGAGAGSAAAPADAAGGPPQTQAAPAPGAAPSPDVARRADSTRRVAAALPAPRALVRVDSLPEVARLDSARRRLVVLAEALAYARQRNEAVDRRVAAARARADIEAPPLAVAGAAAALALALGYAAALVGEIRRPRLADPSEAERITRVRVLAVIRPDEDVTPERARRRADTRALPFVDPAVEGYRLVYLSLVATGGAASRVAVTAAEPGVAAAVALNLAVAAAEDGRSTLVVDADARHATTTAALGLRGRPGLADAVRGAPVAPLVATVPVGRGAALHALPAGRPPAAAPAGRPAGAGAAVPVAADPRADLARVARSYDLTVTSLPPVPAGTAAALPAADGGPPRPAASPPAPETVAREVLAREVIVCARAGHTPLAGLTREIARLNGLGAQVRGLVIWDDDPPALPV